MRPNCTEIIDGIKWSLENEITPHLDDQRALSSVRCMVMLLDHMKIRVGNEIPVLAKDNAEMEAFLNGVSPLFEAHPALLEDMAIMGLAEDLSKAGLRSGNIRKQVPALSDLEKENESLRALMCGVVRLAGQMKTGMPAEDYQAFKQNLDAFLRKQLNRDFQWIGPAFGGKPHI